MIGKQRAVHGHRAAVRRCLKFSRAQRSGSSLILVLSIIAITLATSYAIMRTQFDTYRIQQNGNRRGLARQAAIIGLSVAMRKMEESAWSGVNTTIAGNISTQDSYSVTYTTGDTALTSSSTSYAEYPYRVMLQATGYSIDSNNTQSRATYKVTAVMRLAPRQLAAQPTNWTAMQNYTVYQTDTKNFSIDPPAQVSGPLFLQGAVQLGADYNWSSSIEQQFLGDLNTMRLSGSYADYRPLNGAISLPTSATDSATRGLMTSQLGLTLTNVAQASAINLFTQSNLTTYKIYPGGKSYNVGAVGTSISSTALSPDPINNPLGIYFNGNSISIGSGVTINGTLISGGDINITGSGLAVTPFNLMALSGTTAPVRLPVLVARGNVYFSSTGTGSINGVIVAGSKFWIDSASQTNVISIVGHVICPQFAISARTQWGLTATSWTTNNTLWKTLKVVYPYYPVYLSTINGLSYLSNVSVKADPTVVSNHFFDPTVGPAYVINSTDAGLRWSLVDWRDNQ